MPAIFSVCSSSNPKPKNSPLQRVRRACCPDSPAQLGSALSFTRATTTELRLKGDSRKLHYGAQTPAQASNCLPSADSSAKAHTTNGLRIEHLMNGDDSFEKSLDLSSGRRPKPISEDISKLSSPVMRCDHLNDFAFSAKGCALKKNSTQFRPKLNKVV